MRRLIFATMVLGLASCGGDSLSVGNTSPTGSVGGLVVNAATGAPLAGVAVTLIAGGTVLDPEITGDDGTFGFRGVPAGAVIATMLPPAGFLAATLRGDVPADAGEFPSGNQSLTFGPVGLVPADSTFKFRVLNEQGAPVDGYAIALETTVAWVNLADGTPDARGIQRYTTVTDADGFATVTGLPNYNVLGPGVNDALIAVLPPLDADTNGVYEFAGGVHTFNLRRLSDPTPDVLLDPDFIIALNVAASTISALEGDGGPSAIPTVIDAGDPIYVKFNLPVESASLDARIVREDGTPVSPAPTIGVTGDLLTLELASPTTGSEYNLWIHVVTSVGDRLVEADFAAPFFVRSGAPRVTVVGSPVRMGTTATSPIRIIFSEPIGFGIANPTLNVLSPPNCVLFFTIDLDASGLPLGNAPGEFGSPDCAHTFRAVEPDPIGPVGRSGYSTVWEFEPPAPGGVALPPVTQMQVLFSRVPDPRYLMQRADGRIVADFSGTESILLP